MHFPIICVQNDYLASPTLRSILVVARASLFSSSASASTCQMWFQSCRSEKSTVILLIWARKTWNDEWRHLDGTATASPTCTSLQFEPGDNCFQASQLSRFHSRLRCAQTTSSSSFFYSPSVLNTLRQGSVFEGFWAVSANALRRPGMIRWISRFSRQQKLLKHAYIL